MTTILLVIHLMIAIALVGIILLQRSEGGGLGIGGSGGGGGGGLFTTKETANLLTRTTAILATCFMVTSLTLAILANQSAEPTSILDAEEPASTPFEATTMPEAPLEAMPPAAPNAPLGE